MCKYRSHWNLLLEALYPIELYALKAKHKVAREEEGGGHLCTQACSVMASIFRQGIIEECPVPVAGEC